MTYRYPNSVLLVVDAQIEMMRPAEKSFDQSHFESVRQKISRVLNWARNTRAMPVVHLAYVMADESGCHENFIPGCEPAENEPLIFKSHSDGFIDTELEQLLDAGHIKKIFLVGWYGMDCVLITAKTANAKGYQSRVFDPAVGYGNAYNRRCAQSRMQAHNIKAVMTGLGL